MCGSAKSGYAEEVLADNPTAYWRLDETTGTTLVDVLGVHNGTYDNLPALGSAPLINAGTAVGFDGINQSGTIPHHADLNGSGSNPLTIEMWVRVETPTADARYVFVDKTGLSSSNGQWGIWYENRASQGSPRRLVAFTAVSQSVSWGGQQTEDAVRAGGHLVAVFEPDPISRYRIYWEGVEVAVATRNPAYNAGNTLPLRMAAAATNIDFGNITLDEVAIYNNQALSPERIAAHYNAGSA